MPKSIYFLLQNGFKLFKTPKTRRYLSSFTKKKRNLCRAIESIHTKVFPRPTVVGAIFWMAINIRKSLAHFVKDKIALPAQEKYFAD